MLKKIISMLHWKQRNVIYRSGINAGQFEQFGYYECLKCQREKGKTVLHKIVKLKVLSWA